MGYRSSTDGGYGIGAPTDHVDASHADRIDISDAELLFRGHFARSGPDLVLTGEDGHRLVVTDYFTTEKHPDLMAPNGAHLTGDLVDLLAGSLTPGQYAQTKTTLPPEAIGKVGKVVGQVTLIHNGVAGPLHVGDAVYKADVIQTGANSTCGIAFPDGTALDLVNNTRMAQDIITGLTGQGFVTVNLYNQGNTIEGAGAIGQNDCALSFTNDDYGVIDVTSTGRGCSSKPATPSPTTR